MYKMRSPVNHYLRSISLLLFLSIAYLQSSAQVSGTVFKDFNANGTREITTAFSEIGMAGVTVKATKPNGTALTVSYTGGGTATNNTGGYSVTGGTLGQIRLEFVMPDDYTFASKGASSGTSIMFPALATQDLGVNYPSDYCDTSNPRVAIPCYINGNSQVAGSGAATTDALVTFPYDNGTVNKLANGGTVGAIWGVAYHKPSGKLFTAAFGKRHSNWGPLGPNGIYVSPNAQTANSLTASSSFVNLNTINSAFNAGTVTRNFSPGQGDPTQANYDQNMFDAVGKVGLGDLEASEDGKYLYVINLNDRKLWRIEIGQGGTAPTTAAQIVAYSSFPNPCTGSTFRPFALKIYKGEIYVGGVCDGVSTTNTVSRNNLKATIYKVSASATPASATFTEVFSMPLTFNRKANLNLGEYNGSDATAYRDPNGTISTLSNTSWHPWARSMTDVLLTTPDSRFMYPQPVLSDIEFDVEGSMILGFIDRTGHQGGNFNYGTNTSSGTLYYATSAGDILRVNNNDGTFVLENNGTAGTTTTGGVGNTDGPGGGEFYFQDSFYGSNGTSPYGVANPANHDETSVGGLTLLSGKGTVLNSVFDPKITSDFSGYNSGGVRWYKNSTGTTSDAITLYSNATPGGLGKASGLGDLEAMCDLSPIEIGNRVWDDTDKDGVQDAGELPISGVTVKLYAADGTTLISTAVTDANGNYYFSSATGTSTTSAKYGLALAFNTNYVLSFPTTVSGKLLTQQNNDTNDLIDSDANTAGKITFTTGYAGENDHSFDVGYFTCSLTNPVVKAGSRCGTGTIATSITTACAAGSTIHIFSNAALTTDVTSQFTIAGTSITSPSLTATTTYYAACVDDNISECTSTGAAFILTINAFPTATAAATNATCAGPASNDDGKITLSGFGATDRYDYTTGSTYTGTDTYATATAIPTGGVIVSNLPNPAVSQAYTVRIFNSTGCYVDRTITLTKVTCNCPTVNAPAIADASRCAAGTVTATISTACAATASLKIYSNATLTTDVTSTFTVTASSVTSPSISATKVYYAACVHNTYPTCKSTGDMFTLTVNANPTATASATNTTCSGPNSNNDGTITLAGFTTEKYDYSTGSTYTGTKTYATATAIPATGIIVSNLPNPATTQAYTVRIFNASGCYIDRTVTLNNVPCFCPTVAAPALDAASRCGTGTLTATITTECAAGSTLRIFSDAGLTTDVTSQFTIVTGSVTSPSISATSIYYAVCRNTTYTTCLSTKDGFSLSIKPLPTATATITDATCAGPNSNDNGTITLAGFTTERYDYTIGTTYTGTDTYATATAIPANGIIANNLTNPATTRKYTIRIFNSNGCYIDRTVTLNNVTCLCPTVVPPVIGNATKCGTGTISVTATTNCATGTSLKIFSAAGLATDITSQFTISGNTISRSLTATKTYYAACVHDTYPTCKSTGDDFTMTINDEPTATAVATDPTCTGPTANSDGKITLAGFTTEKYAYTTGATYSGTATYATATAIPANGIIVSNLANPAVSQDYTVRIFNASGCYIDRTVTINHVDCNCPSVAAPAISDASRCLSGTLTTTITTACATGTTLKIYSNATLVTDVTSTFTISGTSVTSPSISATKTYYAACVNNTFTTCKSTGDIFVLTINANPTATAKATNATCAGPTSNNDGSITISGFTTEKYDYTTGSTYTGTDTYATATAIPTDGIIVSNLPNPAVSQAYTVRIFNASGCYIDRTVTLTNVTCLCPTVVAPVVKANSRCGTGTITTTITTLCATGTSFKIFSTAALTTDITSTFTVAGNTLTSPSITATKTYYAACVHDTYPTCKSAAAAFILTVNPIPTVTATAANATCAGPASNDDGSITLAGFTTEKYDYNVGATYTGSATYATATAIPTTGIIVNNLANPATSRTYTVRIFNASGCYIDRAVTLTNVVCNCPTVAAPAIANASRCDDGVVAASITTACATGTSLKIFTDSGLTNDVTSQFTITATTLTSPSLSATTTYYSACVHNTYPTCKSTRDGFILTINDSPTVTADIDNATCAGPTSNNNGTITLVGFTTERYDYTTGSTYTGTDTYATATAIPATGIIVSNLPNPATSQAYTVRIFNSTGCYVDRTVTLTNVPCFCPTVAAPVVKAANRCGAGTVATTVTTACATGTSLKIFSNATLTTDITSTFTIAGTSITSPSITATKTYYAACVHDTYPTCKSTAATFILTINPLPTVTASATNATCAGPTSNNDGKITLAGFTTERYDYTTGSTYTGTDTYATATAIPTGGVIVSNLPNPAVSQAYTVRIFNSSGCYVDRTVTLTNVTCLCPTVVAPVIEDISRCGSGILASPITTECATGTTLKIYSTAALTSDISSQFTITVDDISRSLTVTKTYYAACVHDTYPTCKSAADAFTMTVNAIPTVTADANDPTCTGITPNNDGTITLAGFTTEKYDYTLGATYTGAKTFATATAIPTGGVIANNLANPTTSQSYTIRIFNSVGCYIDRTVVINHIECPCPIVGTPIVRDTVRCGTGALSATLTTNCATGASLKIFSTAALTSDITSQFTITATSISRSLSITKTYYAACVHNTYPTCKGNYDTFIMTVNDEPIATALATNPTCTGPTANSDGKITLADFTTEKYDYSTGSTYIGTKTFATATAIPATGVIVSNLPNPAVSQTYTVRIFNASGCYIDRTVTINHVDCNCPSVVAPAVGNKARCDAGTLVATVSTACATGTTMKIFSNSTLTTDVTAQFTITASTVTSPSISATTTYYAACIDNTYPTCKSSADPMILTINTSPVVTATADNPTCAGPTANADGSITLDNFTTERYAYTTGSTYSGTATYATATAIPTDGVIVSNLANPSTATQAYTVRIFNSTGCFIDRTVTITKVTCFCPTVAAPVIADASRCGTGTLVNNITTGCATGTSLKIFSNSTLTTDVTSTFTIAASTLTSPSTTATKTYYAACVHDTYPTCKSTGDAFVLTINPIPTVTATADNTTCNGPTANADGTITLAGFTTEKYDYNVGTTYTGSATYTTATAIPANGEIVSNLTNPATTRSYTVRIFNASGCYIDRTVTLTNVPCNCPVVAAPAVADNARCGTGTVATTITTACATGTSLKIYSNATLTTDVTSTFTIAGTNITSPSISATKTYYVACVHDTYTTCKSTSDLFVLTVNAVPTVTASATNSTCSGPNSNNDGSITLAGFTTERYAYNAGSTYTGTATYATAAAIPADGEIVSTLPNPATSQTYTIRIFNASDCYVDRVVTLSNVPCLCPTVAAPVVAAKARCGTGTLTTNITTLCATGTSLKIFSNATLTTDVTSTFTIVGTNITSPSISATKTYYAACVHDTYPTCKSSAASFVLTVNAIPTVTATSTDATCNGPSSNNDGTITLAGFTTEKYAYTIGSSYSGTATYATATAIPAGGIIANNLPNPATTQAYTVRIFNSTDCYIDRTVTLNNVPCLCPTVAAPALDAASRCGTGTLTANITTECATGSTLRIFTDTGLTNDVTAQFTIVTGSVTSPSISATTTYYAACRNNTFTTCKSTRDGFILTIKPLPTVTAIADDATCAGPTSNNDGTITLGGFTTERYDYTLGTTYSGTDTYATATAIPANGEIVNNLPNPTTATQAYTVRIFNSNGCYIDRTVTLTKVTCLCPTVAPPVIGNTTKCGTGTISVTTSTNCAAGTSLAIYSTAALTSNITSQFTISGNTITRSLTATQTYYAACVHDTYPTCKSTGDDFIMTINDVPTATAVATDPTCTGPTANSDGKITLAGFTTEKYAYTTGATYSGTATYATATAIPAGGVIVSNLANPAVSQDYTVRIFNANGCYIDRTVTINHVDCNCPTVTAPAISDANRCQAGTVVSTITTACATGTTLKIYSNATLTTDVTSTFTIAATSVTSPSITATKTYYAACVNNTFTTCKSSGDPFVLTVNANPAATATATNTTCSGPNSNNDGKITLNGFTTEKYDYTTGSTYTGTATYATATAIPTDGIIVSNLANPAVSQAYTVRIFNASGCYIDRTVTLTNVICLCPTVVAPVVKANSRCGTGTITTTITTLCATGTSFKIFSTTALTTDITSTFTISGNTLTSPSITASKTYYAACVHDTYPTCKSAAAAFALTVNPIPTVTATAANATCNGPTSNDNGSITLAGFTTEKYDYVTGATYTGSATYATATAIPAGGVIVSNLPNPATSRSYTVRIFSSTDCYVDRVVTLTNVTCNCPIVAVPVVGNGSRCDAGTVVANITTACATGTSLKIFTDTGLTNDVTSQFTITATTVTSPSLSVSTTYYSACVDNTYTTCKSTRDGILFTINNSPTVTASATNTTCTGPTSNSDGSIILAGFTTERYDYVAGNTYTGTDTYATATAIPATGIIVNNLANPATSQAYTVRIFNDTGCYIDRVVTLTNVPCNCPVVAAPVVGAGNRCGAGTVTTSVTTACATGSSLKIFSNATLTTDVTSTFTIGGTNLTSPSISATKTYYAACVHNTYTTCKSTAATFVLTINPVPTATASATNATCAGPSSNNDGKITLAGFTTEKYDYNLGTTYSGSATFATATAIPAGGVIVSNLANPAVSQAYTVRIFNSSGCYVDRTVTLTNVTCLCPNVTAPVVADVNRCGTGTLTAGITTDCATGTSLKIFSNSTLTTDVTAQFTITTQDISRSLSTTTTYYAACVHDTYATCKSTADAFTMTVNNVPTATASATDPTCNGITPNSDGTITLAGFTSEKYDYTLGATYTGTATFATATAIPAGGVIVNNLPNPATTQAYTVRIFNALGCYVDRTVNINKVTCSCPLVAAPAVADITRCGTGTLTATVSTNCATGTSLKVFSTAALTTDISAQFTITSTAISRSLAATKTYYAACVHDTYPTCRSTADAFTMTVNDEPIATALATNPTCTGPTANSDGKITLADFTTEKYDYSTGSTYTGTKTYATATAIPAGGVIVSNLANPAVSQAYTVRIFNASGCYIDRTVTINHVDCNCPTVVAPAVANQARCNAGTLVATVSTACATGTTMKIFSNATLTTDVTAQFTITATSVTSPSISATTTYYAACVNNTFTTCKSSADPIVLTINTSPAVTATATNPTCAGPLANSDGRITLGNFTTEKYDYVTGSTYSGTATYATATAIPVDGVIVSNLPNPATSQAYTVRIFNSTGCYVDRTITLTAVTCNCPIVIAPAIANASRCGTGTVDAAISTNCATGTSLKIFSNSTLTTDVTSTFTIAASTVTSPSISANKTYYAACVHDTYTTCKSSAATFTLTVNAAPTVTATAANTTCNGPTANADGAITLTGFTTEKYDYNVGTTYTGSATYATATAIPAGGVIVSNLTNPATTRSYTVRIFNASGCYIDRTVTLTNVPCNCPVVAAPVIADNARCNTGTITATITTACATGTSLKIYSNATLTTDVTSTFTIAGTNITSPSISATKTYYAICVHDTYTTCKSATSDTFVLTINADPTNVTASATNTTCNGPSSNADGSITLAGFTTEKYAYNVGSTYTGTATYATATAIPADGVIVSTLPNPATSQTYTIRIFNASGCYIDRVVTLTNTPCNCPTVAAPVVAAKSRCGTGTLTTNITTLCATGTSLKIFSNATLTTDVTSTFTVSGSSLTSPSISANKTYYAACVHDTYTTCKSTGASFLLTISPLPTVTATSADATCNGPSSNNDGTITLAGFTTEKYDYVAGSTYTGTKTYATATAIPANGVIVSNLTNPATTQTYTVRIFNSTDCYVDRTVTLNNVTCLCPTVVAPTVTDANRCGSGTLNITLTTACATGTSLKIYSNSTLTTDVTSTFTIAGASITSPSISATKTYYAACVHDTYTSCKSTADAIVLTVNAIPAVTAAATNATCAGPNSNNDGKITLSGFTNEKYDYSLGATYTGAAEYANATAIPVGGVILSNIANPTASQSYTIRIFNSNGCFIDRTVTLTNVTCFCPTVAAPAVGNKAICGSGDVSVSITTACATGTTLKIFNTSTLVTDITSQFTVTANTITKTALAASKTYYAACIHDTYPTCKSTGDAFIMTINPLPTATAQANDVTCTGPTANSDGEIVLSDFTTETYDYSTGSTYTGSATYATATDIPTDGVIVSNLPNPATSQDYTVRIFSATGGCYIDRIVTLNHVDCNCPTIVSPAIANKARCDAGILVATVSRDCAAGTTMKIFSNATLTTDVTSQFTITATTVTSPSISSSTTYYAACFDNTFTTCKSSADAFALNIYPSPTVNAAATNATCNGPTSNTDGKITLSNFTTEKYAYTTGSTYTGSANYASATAIPADGIIVSNLANPAVSQDYTIRIFSATGGCYIDRTVTLTNTPCNCPTIAASDVLPGLRCDVGSVTSSIGIACADGTTLKIFSTAALTTDITSQFTITESTVTSPSISASITYYAACVDDTYPTCKSGADSFTMTIRTSPTVTASVTNATCTIPVANSDGKITLAGFTDEHYDYTAGSTYTGSKSYAGATAIPADGVIVSNLPNPATTQDYTIRIFSSTGACYIDRTVTLTNTPCQCPVVTPPVVADASRCGSGATVNTLTTDCATGSTLKIYSTSALTTDITSQFTFTATTVNRSSLATTRTYYAACVSDAYPTCKSTGDAFVITINPKPTVTATTTNATCSGPNSNSDGEIVLAGFTSEKYAYSIGNTYSGSITSYATATAIPADGVIVSNLPNPATSQSYTVRIFNSLDCYIDRVVTLTNTPCDCPIVTSPSVVGGSRCASGVVDATITTACTTGTSIKIFSDAALTTDITSQFTIAAGSITSSSISSTTTYHVACVHDTYITCKSSGNSFTLTINPLPTVTASASNPTCAGSTVNSDGKITLAGFTTEKYDYNVGTSYTGSASYATATTIPADGVIVSSIANPAASESYTIRIFSPEGCYVDRTVSISKVTCNCPTITAPVVTNGSRCGSGTVTASISTACAAGTSLKIFSNTALTTDVTSQFTITATTVTSPVLTANKIYYAACIHNTYTSCKSIYNALALTIKAVPNATASSTNTTCTGLTSNNDGSITLAGFTTETYDYTTGSSYTGSKTFATATAIPADGIIVNNLPNPTTTQDYTVRIFNSVGCYVDRIVTLSNVPCDCPIVAAPVIVGKARCGTGTFSNVPISTPCESTASLRIFSDAALTTDITAQFTITATSLTSPSISATTIYYAACQDNTYTNCLSNKFVFPLAVNPVPTATASASNATCTGPLSNLDGKIVLAGYTLEKYDYNAGNTYTGSTTHAEAKEIPADGVIASNLPNPTTSQIYSVRIINSIGCSVTRKVTLTNVPCDCPTVDAPVISDVQNCGGGTITVPVTTSCASGSSMKIFADTTLLNEVTSQFTISASSLTSPNLTTTNSYFAVCVDDTYGTCKSLIDKFTLTITQTPEVNGYGIPASCSNGTTNNDASIELYGISNATKYAYSLGRTYSGANYSAATSITGTSASILNLANTGTATTYTIRVFNGSDNCFKDIQIVVPYNKDCNTSCVVDAGLDKIICEPTATIDFVDATAAQEWIVGSTNPSAATINASTGVVSGMTANGIYTFILRDKVNTTCFDEVNVFRSVFELPFVTSCESSYQLPSIAGVTWSSVSGGASVSATGLITGMNTTGHYIFGATYGTCTSEMTVEKINCLCTLPTNATPIVNIGTCNGSTLNNDASIVINSITGNKASISTAGATTFDGNAYNAATTVVGNSITFSGLQHGKNYIIRIYNTADTCFKDVTVSIGIKTCCSSPNCVGVTIIKNTN